MRVSSHRSFRLDLASEGTLLSALEGYLRASGRCRELGPREARLRAGRAFSEDGWIGPIQVLESNLTVSFVRDSVAVCIQLGNVARTYADLLKLEAMFRDGRIDASVIVVPDDALSRDLGSNHASFERLEREIELFSKVIHVPILLIGTDD
ncbi:MAG: BglII/BstYI family type II restriction endonuclease [Coriobacteriia bacterium]